MKKNILFALLGALTLTITGCGAKPKPQTKPLEFIKSTYSNNDNIYTVYGYATLHKNTVLQNAAIIIRAGAEDMKSKGYKYMKVTAGRKYPFIITKFEDLASYCFPENNGYSWDDMDERSTSLESGKCSLRGYVKDDDKKVVSAALEIFGFNTPQSTPVWSVDQIINDPIIDNYIKAAYANQPANLIPLNLKPKIIKVKVNKYTLLHDFKN
jgi:hypothetical protein